MNTPAITVLTAVRNGGRYLAETIESIQAQTFSDWEYILVDDASEDDTIDVIERFAAEDVRIRLIRRSERGGPYQAANEGLKHARGAYIARLDADDPSLPNRFERQLAFLSSAPALRACASLWLRMTEEGDALPGLRGIVSDRPKVLAWTLCVRGGLHHSTLFIERQALDLIGGYRELPYSQDYRLWCDLSRRGWLGVVPEALAYFRRHPHRVTVTESDLQMRLGTDVRRDHLVELSGQSWSHEEMRELWEIGQSRLPFRRGLTRISAWEALWKRDETLDPKDRRDLSRFTRTLRTSHLKAATRLDRFTARVRSIVAAGARHAGITRRLNSRRSAVSSE